jgi:hypothetical protein
MRGRRIVVVALGLALLASGALAQESAAMTTYAGDCSFKGMTHAFPGAHWLPVPGYYIQDGSGHCKGTLDGKPFDGAISFYTKVNMDAPMSCAGGYWLGGGPLYITFLVHPPAAPASARSTERTTSKKKKHPRRRRHHRPPENPVMAVWTYDLHSPPGMAELAYQGVYRGWAVGTNHLDTPPSTIDDCNGPGVHEIGFDGTFTTVQDLHG